MNAKPKKSNFEEVRLELALDPSFIEKDWFVTQVLLIISNIKNEEFQLVFTGGTALSKAYNLIQRISEDIDFRIVSFTKETNRKSLSTLKSLISSKLREKGFKVPEERIRAKNENKFFAIDIDYDTYFNRLDSLRPSYTA